MYALVGECNRSSILPYAMVPVVSVHDMSYDAFLSFVPFLTFPMLDINSPHMGMCELTLNLIILGNRIQDGRGAVHPR